jgi:hypothetical protein
LQAGQGLRLPAAPFNLTWWNSTDYPNSANDPNVESSGTTFTLAHTPVSATVRLYAAGGNTNPQEGRLMPGAGNDFTSGATLTMLNGSFAAGTILADYSC